MVQHQFYLPSWSNTSSTCLHGPTPVLHAFMVQHQFYLPSWSNTSSTCLHGHKDICTSCKPRELDPELPGPAPPPVNQPHQEEPPATAQPPQTEAQPIPEWASQLASGIPLLASSLDKLLSRLNNPKVKPSKRRAPSPSDEDSEDYSRAPSPIAPEPSLSEGELSDSSDQEEHEPAKHSYEAVDSLISSVLETLHLQEPETTSDSAKALFKRHNKSSPTHSQLDLIIQQEWDKPERRFQVNRRFTELYPFPTDLIEKWATPPSVDAPVSRLSKTTALPVPDASSFKDAMDKKMGEPSPLLIRSLGHLPSTNSGHSLGQQSYPILGGFTTPRDHFRDPSSRTIPAGRPNQGSK
ncbi:hypothetical protein XENTR_v10004015 [Xenopus tropicalis]|nr:hypothetical protein XENTR_v10004015 [Xenopus tropicalis]KAE8576009.1 hypothetical protein XENTR_v10004015 [Xenopus tropicalis]